MKIGTKRFLAAIVFGMMLNGATASEDSSQNLDMTVNDKIKKLIVEMDAIERRALADIELPTLDQVDMLRQVIREIQAGSANCQPKPFESVSAKTRVATPSGPVQPNALPSSQEEMDKMQEAVARTHLPGPPIKEVPSNNEPGQFDNGWQKSLATVMDDLDAIEAELDSGQADALNIINTLRQTRLRVERILADGQCHREGERDKSK